MSMEQPRRELAEDDPMAEGFPDEPEPPESEREAEEQMLEEDESGRAE